MTNKFKNKKAKEQIRQIIDRMCIAYGCNKKELSTHIECQQGTINNWVHFGRVPYPVVEKCSLVTGQSMDWLIFGKQNSHIKLDKGEFIDLTEVVSEGIKNACDLQTIRFNYPDAGEKLIKKITKDVALWISNNKKQKA